MAIKQYKDFFGKKLTKYEVVQATIHTVRTGNPYPAHLSRQMGIGYFKATRLAKVLADAKVTSPMDAKPRRVHLKEDEAVNAALRQLKKGSK
jgi:hypothetical protein